ncbi:acyltransferase [Terracoccus sp. 273MFTsu3.1]|uniref:acyltransferase family protein n=1 Tax=Terracoccus sp. 273MFTsu3.1 TaxID=1172188 RepID=UPI00035C9A36|nr:acyltransferase [Terracoccus sp. 273MFTsu3.1]
MSTRPPAPQQHPGGSRLAVLDGFRGIAIVLVVLSHLGKVWPEQLRPDLGPVAGLFAAGSIGVTIFLVVGGFLVTRGMLAARSRDGLRGPIVSFTRRLVRISLQVYLLLAVVAVVAEIDPTDPNSRSATNSSLFAVATYWWNVYVRTHALDARSDLGPLYYLSIELQFYVVLLVLVLLLSRHRRVLAALLAAAIPVVTAWRWYVYDTQGWFAASLMTSTRMDGLLYGALAALLVDLLPDRLRDGLRRQSAPLVGGALLVVVGVVVSCAFYDIGAYFKVQGIVLTAACALLVLGCAAPLDPRAYAVRALSEPRLAWLGAASLSIFVWHVPIFELTMRHTPDWPPAARTAVAVAALAGVVLLVERFVARPVTLMVRHVGTARPVTPPVVGPSGSTASTQAATQPAVRRGPATEPVATVATAAAVAQGASLAPVARVATVQERDDWDDGFEDFDYDGPVRD